MPVSTPMIFDDADIHSAALCVWKEARGEGLIGMIAVLWVLHNRVGKPGFASHLHDVVYGKNQFTSMSVPSDPEFNLQPAVDDDLFSQAWKAAEGIFAPASTMTDITRGALYYANLHEISSTSWFYQHIVLDSANHPIREQIGKHTFFA